MQTIAFNRHFLTAVVVAVTILGSAARAEDSDDSFTKTVCDTAALEGLNNILEAIGIHSGAAGATYEVWEAYLKNPNATRLKAVQDKIAGGVAGLLIPGYGPATTAGKFAIDGVEYTIDQANAMRVNDLLCGGSDFGDTWPVGFFSLESTQQIASGINCENFAEKIMTQQDFDRLKSLYWNYYVPKVFEFTADAADRATKKQKLEQMWQSLYLAWRVKMGVKIDQKLRDAFIRETDMLKSKAECKPVTSGSAPGEDTADPALQPEPPTPPGGHYVLVKTEIVTSPAGPDNVINASPQKISFKAPYGEMTCAWSTPPKSVSGEFEISLQVSSTPAKGQNLQAYIVANSGFPFVSGTPNPISGTSNEAYANGTNGVGETGYAKMRLGPGDIASATPGQLLYFVVGGCAGKVTYTYNFIG